MRKINTSFFFTATAVTAFLLITLSACHKKSGSDFTLNKYEYSAGQMVEVTNNLPKKNQIWEIVDPEGTVRGVYYEWNPQIIIPLRSIDGVYTICLYDNKKEKGDKIRSSKNILVKSVKGKLNIYSSSWVDNNFKVTIDGEFMGSGVDGELNMDIPVGYHYIEVVSRFSSRKETIEVLKNQTVYVSI